VIRKLSTTCLPIASASEGFCIHRWYRQLCVSIDLLTSVKRVFKCIRVDFLTHHHIFVNMIIHPIVVCASLKTVLWYRKVQLNTIYSLIVAKINLRATSIIRVPGGHPISATILSHSNVCMCGSPLAQRRSDYRTQDSPYPVNWKGY